MLEVHLSKNKFYLRKVPGIGVGLGLAVGTLPGMTQPTCIVCRHFILQRNCLTVFVLRNREVLAATRDCAQNQEN